MIRTLGVVLLALILGFGAGCGDQAKDQAAEAALAEVQAAKAQAELEARNVQLIKTVIAEIDKGNPEIMLKLYAPDAKFFFPSGSTKPLSREAEVAMARTFLAGLSDLTHEITDIFAVKDKVVLRAVVRGTHRAELEGIPQTGSKIALSVLAVFRIKEGLVVEEAEDADMLGFYQQLGMELRPKAPAKPAAATSS